MAPLKRGIVGNAYMRSYQEEKGKNIGLPLHGEEEAISFSKIKFLERGNK